MSKATRNFPHKNKPEPTAEQKAEGNTAPRPVAVSLNQQLAELMYLADPKMDNGQVISFVALAGEEQAIHVERARTCLESIDKLNLMVTAKRDIVAEHDRKHLNKDHLIVKIKEFNEVLKKQHRDPKKPFNLTLYPVEELALRILA